MSMENATKAASGFVEALKHQPLLLVLAVTNFALLGFAYYQSAIFNAQRKENVTLFVETQRETQKLLSECIVPQRQRSDLPPLSDPPIRVVNPGGG